MKANVIQQDLYDENMEEWLDDRKKDVVAMLGEATDKELLGLVKRKVIMSSIDCCVIGRMATVDRPGYHSWGRFLEFQNVASDTTYKSTKVWPYDNTFSGFAGGLKSDHVKRVVGWYEWRLTQSAKARARAVLKLRGVTIEK